MCFAFKSVVALLPAQKFVWIVAQIGSFTGYEPQEIKNEEPAGTHVVSV